MKTFHKMVEKYTHTSKANVNKPKVVVPACNRLNRLLRMSVFQMELVGYDSASKHVLSFAIGISAENCIWTFPTSD